MSDLSERPDPRLRPPDPAGTRPKVDPESLVLPPAAREEAVVDAEVIEEAAPPPASDLLPQPAARGGGLAPRADQTPHAPRFQFLLGVLIAFGVAAIAATAAVVVERSQQPSPFAWSAWHPAGSGVGAVQQIAAHVGPEYRLPGGHQLVAVSGGPLEVAGVPMTVVLRSDPAANGNISILSGTGALYRMCGLGPRCAIDQGPASHARLLLLQRQALELALYTFRYVDGVNQVVVLLPPPPGQKASVSGRALFFRPTDVALALDRPLRETLTRRAPSLTTVSRSPDAPVVVHLTTSTLYDFTLTQSNVDNTFFLVLRPFGVTG